MSESSGNTRNPTGEHTWEMHLAYERCKICGRIFEDRQPFKNVLSVWEKLLTCPFCNHQYVIQQHRQPTFGPLFGESTPAEQEW